MLKMIGEARSGPARKSRVKRASVKQEENTVRIGADISERFPFKIVVVVDEASKFDRIFNKTSPPTAEPEKRPAQQRAEKAALGRPPGGKRSDPAWKQFSILLKRETQREAAAILKATDEGQDLSGLVQTLLERWIKQHRS